MGAKAGDAGIVNPQRLTVPKLRIELEKRKLDSSGTKPVLVERLKEALEKDNKGEEGNVVDDDAKKKNGEEEEIPPEEDAKGNELETMIENKEKTKNNTSDNNENSDTNEMDTPSLETDEDDTVFDAHDDGTNPIVKSNRLTNARKILRRNPYDATAWDVFFVEARGRPSVAKDIFEEILRYHPRCVNAWIAYAQSAMEKKDDEAVSEIFSRCLRDVLSPALWLAYVNYVKATNEDGTTEEGAKAIKAAFEYCVDHVGEDVESGNIWEEYVDFIKGVNPGFIAPEGAQPEQYETARMMELRRVYQRAISVPTQSLESLVTEYETFENSYDKKFARTLLAESTPKIFACKTAYKERETLNKALLEGSGFDVKVHKNGIAVGDPVHTSKAADCHLDAFRRFIAWEKTNPQKLEAVGIVSAAAKKMASDKPEEEPPRVRERIALAYEKCLLTCENYPEVWLEYSHWHESAGRAGDAAEILSRARTVLPGSIMLLLAAADLEESQQNFEGMKAVYESYMVSYEEKRKAENAATGEGTIVKMMDDDTSVVYAEYIRACRRTDSQASSRKAFLRARKAPGCSWLVYAAAALVEWRYDEADKPCRNVFELGLKTYMHVPAYVLTYTNHLISLGDVGNTRVVFERALSVEKPDVSIFDAFVKFEHEYGSFESFRAAEIRRSEFLEPDTASMNSGLFSRLTAAKLVANVFERHNFIPDVAPLRSESLSHYANLGVSSIQKHMAMSVASGKKEISRQKLPPPPKAPKGAPPPLSKAVSAEAPSASAPGDATPMLMTAPRAAPPSIGLSALPVVVAPALPETLRELFNKLPGPVAFAKMPAPRVDAVLDALKNSDLTIEGKAELLAQMQGKDTRTQSMGSKRTATQMMTSDMMAEGESSSFRIPTKDVFRERQSKMQKASAEEYQ